MPCTSGCGPRSIALQECPVSWRALTVFCVPIHRQEVVGSQERARTGSGRVWMLNCSPCGPKWYKDFLTPSQTVPFSGLVRRTMSVQNNSPYSVDLHQLVALAMRVESART